MSDARPARRNAQTVSDPGRGDCFRSCLTSILGVAPDATLPDGGDPEFFRKYDAWLTSFGLAMHYEPRAMWRRGLWIASVPSLNYPGVTHAIVMDGDEVAFDPSPLQRRAEGESLLGKGVVRAGWYLEVIDASKVGALVKAQEAA